MSYYGGAPFGGPPPPPWQIVVAPGQPRPYFYNPVTKVTTWEPPPQPALVPVAPSDAAPSGIPRPDPVLEPERYQAWLQVTQHMQSGDKNTASFSGLQNAGGNGIKGHILDAAGLKLGDCNNYPKGACFKGDMCKHTHNRNRFGHLYGADGLPKVKPIPVDDGRPAKPQQRRRSPRRENWERSPRERSPPRRRRSPSPVYRRRGRSRSPDYDRRRSPPRSYSRRDRDRYR